MQSDIVYAAINPGFIQFFGSDKIAAKTFASAIQSDLYAFSAKDVREWRGMTSISRAAFGVVPIPTLEESIALSRIGKESPRSLTPLKKRIEWTIKAFRAELLECKSFAGSIQLTYAKNVHDNTIIECLKTIVTDLPEEFLNVFAPNETSPEKIIETATETVLKLADKKLFTSRAGLYPMNEMVIEIMDSALDEAIRIASKNSETNTQNYCLKKDIRDNSVDSTTYGKVLRWKKRCDILDSIKKVHEEGIKRKGYEIAEEHNVSPALVSKINMMYKSNKNLTKDDLWEKIRGPKPDPFKIVPAEIYAKLCWIVENEGPAKFNLPFFPGQQQRFIFICVH